MTWTPEHEAIWQGFRRYHPHSGGRGGRCPTPDAKMLTTFLANYEADDGVVLIEWAHDGEDPYAKQMQGEQPWPDGKKQRRLGLADLFVQHAWSKRIDLARQRRDGADARPATVVTPAAERAADACLAVLADLCATVPDPRVHPPRHDRPPNPKAASRAMDLLRRCGDWELYVEAPDAFRSRLLSAVEAHP